MKLKYLIEYFIMRYFSTSKKFIGWYIQNKYRGSFQLKNGTWVVHQSDDFKRWVYTEGYDIYKSKISKQDINNTKTTLEELVEAIGRTNNIKTVEYITETDLWTVQYKSGLNHDVITTYELIRCYELFWKKEKH